jgi:hypothetical protein
MQISGRESPGCNSRTSGADPQGGLVVSEKKYSIVEIIVAAVSIPVFAVVAMLISLPVLFLLAWIRVTIYNWFAPAYLHLPVLSVWVMLAIGMFAATFSAPRPIIKDEYLKIGTTKQLVFGIFINLVILVVAWGIHRWILAGRP